MSGKELLTMATREQNRQLDKLMRTPRALTSRDLELMKALSRVKVMDLTQIWRLLWPESPKSDTAYNRLRELVHRDLLASFEFGTTTQLAGLSYHLGYHLSSLGQALLERLNLPPGYQPKSAQVGHDLLVAEVYVRLQLALQQRQPAWSCRWYGEKDIGYYPTKSAKTPVLVPDALAILEPPQAVQPAFSFFLEMDVSRASYGRPSSSIGRKVIGYGQFGDRPELNEIVGQLPAFPWVVFVVAGARRMPRVAEAILTRRRSSRVNYALAVLEDVARSRDLLAEPIWAKIRADETLVWGASAWERTPLLAG